jgi:hypothetical protein
MASETVADRDVDLSRESQQGKQQRSWLYRFFFGPS